MRTIKQSKKSYLHPKTEVIKVDYTSIICTSPGGGGSEGTGNEPLFP